MSVSDTEDELCKAHTVTQLQKYRRISSEPSQWGDLLEANSPSPANGADDVDILSVLSWTPGSNATSHNVYFGTGSPPALQGNLTDSFFDPGKLRYDTSYYWRVDEVNVDDTQQGNTWSFTTEAAPQIKPDEGPNWSLVIPPYVLIVFVLWVSFMWVHPLYSLLLTLLTVVLPCLVAWIAQRFSSEKYTFSRVFIVGTWCCAILYPFGMNALF